ncbi:MAG: lipid-A-disaccharide synthase [Verrucomicrobiota bacterium]
MRPLTFMFIAGEASGDALAAELVKALSPAVIDFENRLTNGLQPLRTTLSPRFFGGGGPKMAAAGVELAVDLTAHAVFGLFEVLKHYSKFKGIFNQLVALAMARQPEVIILVDYGGLNRRFAAAIKKHVRARRGTFNNWDPKIVYYVSPQVWASRAQRARQLERDVDLLLSIFPFERDWYARRAPRLHVEFVGHPLIDRHGSAERRCFASSDSGNTAQNKPIVLLLPGSREQELKQHLPVIIATARRISAKHTVRFRMVFPTQSLADISYSFTAGLSDLETNIGDLSESLAEADLAIASSGTVTMECAFFAVPTIVLYKVSWPLYQIAKRMVRVNYIAMPNLLAGEEIYPEFIQSAATSENIANAALKILNNPTTRTTIKAKLAKVVESLGLPGASERAAKAIVNLLRESHHHDQSDGTIETGHLGAKIAGMRLDRKDLPEAGRVRIK